MQVNDNKSRSGWRDARNDPPAYAKDTDCVCRYKEGYILVTEWLAEYKTFAGPKLPVEWKPMPGEEHYTNYEFIKSLSIEEMAVFFALHDTDHGFTELIDRYREWLSSGTLLDRKPNLKQIYDNHIQNKTADSQPARLLDNRA